MRKIFAASDNRTNNFGCVWCWEYLGGNIKDFELKEFFEMQVIFSKVYFNTHWKAILT